MKQNGGGGPGEIEIRNAAAAKEMQQRMQIRARTESRTRAEKEKEKEKVDRSICLLKAYDKRHKNKATEQKSSDSQHAPSSDAFNLASVVSGSASSVETDGLVYMHAHGCFRACMCIAVRTQRNFALTVHESTLIAEGADNAN